MSRDSGPAQGNVSADEISFINSLINAIRQFVLAVSLSIWAVVGFLFWIPMLVHAIVQFSALIVYATITDADPSTLATNLERAVRFYLEGFRKVVRAIYRRTTVGQSNISWNVDTKVMLVHVVGTLIFWVVIVVTVTCAVDSSFGTRAHNILFPRQDPVTSQ